MNLPMTEGGVGLMKTDVTRGESQTLSSRPCLYLSDEYRTGNTKLHLLEAAFASKAEKMPVAFVMGRHQKDAHRGSSVSRNFDYLVPC